jgi:beta-N-acetylhexosaminidase/D-alanyl-D-alanine dipeptidase
MTAALLLWVALQSQLVELKTLDPRIPLDIRYATPNNFTHKPVYDEARCFLQRPAAEALVKVQEELQQQGLSLKMYDCYRPLSVQKKFWALVSGSDRGGPQWAGAEDAVALRRFHGAGAPGFHETDPRGAEKPRTAGEGDGQARV